MLTNKANSFFSVHYSTLSRHGETHNKKEKHLKELQSTKKEVKRHLMLSSTPAKNHAKGDRLGFWFFLV